MTAIVTRRKAKNAWWPSMTSRTRSGDASMAWYCRSHLIAESTGQLDSKLAICIAVAAMSPGATNSRYEMPFGRSVERSTKTPSPTPSASRYTTGVTAVVIADPRQIRLYCVRKNSSGLQESARELIR